MPKYVKAHGISLDKDSILMFGVLNQNGNAMLLDGVLEFQPVTEKGVSITAYRKLDENSHFFDGHFPGKPVCPGHYLLQMAYLTAQLFHFCLTGKTSFTPWHIRAKELTNRAPALPGDTMYITCIEPEMDDETFACSAVIKNQNGTLIASVDNLCFFTKPFDPATVTLSEEKPGINQEIFQLNGLELDYQNIIAHSLLPHRGHALLVDGVTSFRKTSHDAIITSTYNLMDKGIFFSGYKFCQGHYMLEMAYLTAALFHYCLTGETKGAPAPFRTTEIAFLRPALPGETLKTICCAPELRSRTFSCSATVTDSDNRPIANFGRINGISLK
ncbi:hypothetical protein HGA34_01435 [Candidatus Falkowbacteria bacterium]|nr:hypothetical protein [Candidatus Falkowbacteria bacterium]